MPFIPHTEAETADMLRAAGAESLPDLFAHLPEDLKLQSDLQLPPALSEAELARRAAELAGANCDPGRLTLFVGAGAYDHYCPAVVAELAHRPEFYTAYTPYQPEVSQGLLQSIFEYQTMIASLCALDVANASLYEGATAVYEAALLAVRATRRNRILVDGALNPRYRALLRAYASNMEMAVEEVPHSAGASDLDGLAAKLDAGTAAAVVASPNFFGRVCDTSELAAKLHANKSLLIACANPLALAVVKPPGEMGADVACGDAQPLGLALGGGGPHLGFIAATDRLARKLPGRLVGQTVDGEGRRGFVLTLQAREQHIRREKATSNICSNQALCALQAGIFLASVGREGLREAAMQCLAKTAFARGKLAALPGCSLPFDGPGFHEFVLKLPVGAEDAFKKLLRRGIAPGLPLGRFFPDLAECLLVCVTEKRTRGEIELLAAELGRAIGEG
ncbi:MAG: aminomethyl-transferring glycine dehydrogenase subunit GcvPA [Planctomycetota bacterium]